MLTAQPCYGLAEKVSLILFACSLFEVASQSRYTLQASEIESLRDVNFFYNKDHYQPMLNRSRQQTGHVMREAALPARTARIGPTHTLSGTPTITTAYCGAG